MKTINKQIIENIMTNYNKKRLKAANDADLRREKLYQTIPNLEEIEKKIKLSSINLSKLFLSNPENLQEQILVIKEEIGDFKKQRHELYKKYNIPENYLEVEYECSKCNDTGYLPDGKRCSCLNKQIINHLYTMSNMVHMLKKENFDTFDISVFSNEINKS
ncbi:MAG: DNA replication protein DnaC, partial [Sedimentibacter sp.]